MLSFMPLVMLCLSHAKFKRFKLYGKKVLLKVEALC